MDSIRKFLRSLTAKEQEAIQLMMLQLIQDFRKVPHVQALKGKPHWYRCRLGRYRIIFMVNSQGQTRIMRVSKRDESTYKRLG